MKKLFIIVLAIFILCCNNKNPSNYIPGQKQVADTSLTEAQLISHVKLAINPRFDNWVLFSNGTYIILPDSLTNDKPHNALKIIKEFGPVHPGSSAGDISIITLNKTEGWVVGGHFYGMYTYVHPNEMVRAGITGPSDIDIGYYGRNKRNQDAKDLKIIYINH